MPLWIKRYIFVFCTSFVACYIATPIIRWIAIKLKILDYPSEERRIHTKPTPLLGGLAIYGAYSIAILATFYYTNPLKVVVIGGLIVLLIGVIDDIRSKGIPAILKFIALVGLTIWLSRHGIIVHLFKNYYLNLLLTIFWIVGVTSAFNSIDNMDGLATGIGCIASTMFFIVALQSDQWWFGLLSIALVGSTLGFLKYNFKPAKIFLGDGGSLLLGFTLAAIAVMGGWSENIVIAFVIPMLILAIPIFDIMFVVAWRYKNGVTKGIKDSIAYCGKDHISHKLEELGLSQNRAVILLYFLSICLGIGAIVLRQASTVDALLLAFQAVLILFIVIILLNIGRDKIVSLLSIRKGKKSEDR